ncbi:MAG: branched-chain-amino-acid transaminase [Opitutales bacterium]
MKVYINGEFFEKEEAKVSVFDHGFLYGDGIFEGIRLYEGNVYQLDAHLERFEYSARALRLNLIWSRAEIAEAVCESCRVNGLTNGYIRLIATRGIGTLGLNPHNCSEPQLICIADKIQLYPQEYYEKGLKIITAGTRRTSVAAIPPMVKSLNYLNNILAKMEAIQAGCMECLMLNDQGYVAECSGDNVFIIHKGKVITPPVSSGSLTGITRGAVIEIASDLGIPFEEKALTRFDIWIADECFLTGTAAEVIPVVELDARPVGDGRAGPITHKILGEFRQRVLAQGTRI